MIKMIAIMNFHALPMITFTQCCFLAALHVGSGWVVNMTEVHWQIKYEI